jgi:hypothetical protein
MCAQTSRLAVEARPANELVRRRADPFRLVALDEIRPAAVEDQVAALARRAPR